MVDRKRCLCESRYGDMESRLHDFTISYRATAGISHISLNMARTNRQKDHLEINADMTIMPVNTLLSYVHITDERF